MPNRTKLVIGGAFIALAVAYLIYSGMEETAAYYLTVSEALSGEGSRGTDALRVKGQVREGSVDWNPEEMRLTFVLTDNQQQVPVSYHGAVPDLFAEGREVIVEGRFGPQALIAESILSGCPSKYEPHDGARADPTA